MKPYHQQVHQFASLFSTLFFLFFSLSLLRTWSQINIPDTLSLRPSDPKIRDSFPWRIVLPCILFQMWIEPNFKTSQIFYETDLPFPVRSKYKQILREMGRVILLDKSCAHKTSLADGPRNRCPFSINRTSTSQRRSAQLWEKGLSNNPTFWCMHRRLLYPVVSLETLSWLFFNLSNRGLDLVFGHNAPYSGNAHGQRGLWQSFSHASRAHPDADSQVEPSFRKDPEKPLVSSATSQARKHLIHWEGYLRGWK